MVLMMVMMIIAVESAPLPARPSGIQVNHTTSSLLHALQAHKDSVASRKQGKGDDLPPSHLTASSYLLACVVDIPYKQSLFGTAFLVAYCCADSPMCTIP